MPTDMPTTLNIPSRTERHCAPCEFHKLIGCLHVRSGPGGYREYSCKHPAAYEPLPTNTPVEEARAIGRIETLLEREGRYIGRTEKQPGWCPLKREEGATA